MSALTPMLNTSHDLTSRQGIFDYVVEKLVKQGEPALELKSGSCQMRGKGGTKCAVGHLIPDAAYHPDIEAEGLIDDHPSFNTNPALKALDSRVPRTPSVRRLLIAMQKAHDRYTLYSASEWLREWKIAMGKIAKRYKLTPPAALQVAA